MKTAIQGLIEELEMMYEDQFNENEKTAIKNCLIATHSYLETEKHQIIEAYKSGKETFTFVQNVDYYNETFKNE